MNKTLIMGKEKEPVEQEEVQEKTDEEVEQEVAEALGQLFQQSSQESTMRVAELYGEINEEMGSNIVASMLILKDSGRKTVQEGDEAVETYDPFELFISTPGGTAVDMFAIYDTMRMVKEDCEIHTVGLGKVMSAGVVLLLLAQRASARSEPTVV